MKWWVWMIAGLVFWIAETWYFGWNAQPESAAEAVCDLVAVALLWTGLCAYHLSLERRVDALEQWMCRQDAAFRRLLISDLRRACAEDGAAKIGSSFSAPSAGSAVDREDTEHGRHGRGAQGGGKP